MRGEKMDEQFILAKNDFIVSLSDGYDLRRNAAEYIIAWESLEKSPDNFYLHGLFDTAKSNKVEPVETHSVTSVGVSCAPSRK